jgi:peptide/nickel transport system substrate-binding protein
MRWKKPATTAAVGALVVVAACGGGSDSGTSDSQTFIEGGGKGQVIDMSRSEGPAEPVEGATEGGTVNVLSEAGLNTMMPSEVYYTNAGAIASDLVMRSLTQFDYDKKTGDITLIPDLATSWTHNSDNTEWTFTIRDGIKYENGDPVEMEDFKTGAMMSMDRTTFPEGATYRNNFFLHGGCDPGDKEVYEGYYTTGPDYDGVEINGNKITYKMACPFPDMPYWGSFPALGPIPEDAINTQAKLKDYVNHPLATGPYMFDHYVPEKELTLVRNPEWDPNTDPSRHAYPDEYDMDFDVDSAKTDNIMIEDSEPTSLTYDDVQSSTYLKMKADSPDRLVPGPEACTWYLAPDYRKITEKKVREALAYGFPYEAYLEAAGEVVGATAKYPTSNVMPPGMPGREEYNVLPGLKPGETDPEKAKQLLAEAGYKPGEYKVTWLYQRDDQELVDAKDQVVKGLEAAGFTVQPVATTTAAYSTDREDANSSLNLRFAGWCSDFPSGGSWIPPLFQSTNLEAEGLAANYEVFSEPDVDRKIAEINKMSSAEEQAKAWNDLEKYIQEKYFAVAPVYYTGAIMAHGSAIQNMDVDPTFGMPTFKDMWVKQ